MPSLDALDIYGVSTMRTVCPRASRSFFIASGFLELAKPSKLARMTTL